jgi:hypothetical protein
MPLAANPWQSADPILILWAPSFFKNRFRENVPLNDFLPNSEQDTA